MKLTTIVILASILMGCDVSNSTLPPPESSASTSINLQCDLTVNYIPETPPVISAGTGMPTITIIALHGKSGSPTRSFMSSLASDLNTQGYKVVMPYMPWSELVWDGTLCESISYINGLIKEEAAAGNSVILLGHSMGGVVLLNYGALTNTTKPKAFVIAAPGHYVPNSSVLASLHASSIQLAKNMISNGQGDINATFQTSDYKITTTPNIYLSFHGIDQLSDQFSDINASIKLMSVSTLWLAGQSDPLTPITKNIGFIDTLSTNSFFKYKEVIGDHYTMLGNVTSELDLWYQGL